jgi:hypothetical protein
VAFPTLQATDDAADAAPSLTLACKGAIDGKEVPYPPVTVAASQAAFTRQEQFGYGTTVVTCTATDAAGNEGPAVSFAVVVACGAGYSFRDGACRGERPGRGLIWVGGASHTGCRHAPRPPDLAPPVRLAPSWLTRWEYPPPRRVPPADNDECAVGGGNTCSPNANCANTGGSFTCACKDGFLGNGTFCEGEAAVFLAAPRFPVFPTACCGNRRPLLTTLAWRNPINPSPLADAKNCTAAENPCGEHFVCTDVPGSYECACAPGYSNDAGACNGGALSGGGLSRMCEAVQLI